MVGDDPLAEALERQARGDGHEPVVALAERAQQLLVVAVKAGRQVTLDTGEEWSSGCRAPDQHERVVRDTDERRGEHRQERLVVVAVLEQAQIGEDVDDLLLAEVAAAGGAVGRQPGAPELFLVPLGVGAGREQQHDLPGLRGARVDELAHAAGDVPRLSAAPVLAGVGVARLVGDEQLDRVAEDRIGEVARGRERLELVAELVAEEEVDGREHLRP